jgi:hypothetical protein
MVMFVARSAALASAIVGVVLCEALVCQPAEADYYAFGNTQGHIVTLDLLNGSSLVSAVTTVDVTTAGVQGWMQGWISTHSAGIGGPNSTNTNYGAGVSNNNSYNDYFGFNLDVVNPNVIFTSAKLVVYSGRITSNLQYNLFGATNWLTDMEMGSPNTSLYENMVSGVNYGSFLVHGNTPSTMSTLVFTLNSSAVSEIHTAIANRGDFAVAGQVSASVPEPSTWIMMLAGFAGLGLAGLRRAARRRRPRPVEASSAVA